MKRNFNLQNKILWKFFPFLLIFFIMASLAVYSMVLPSYFMADDFVLIAGVSEDLVECYHNVQKVGFLRPIILLSYYIDNKIWNFNASGFHLTNVLLHAINSFLVSSLALILLKSFSLKNILNKKDFFISFFAGLFFLVMQCHSESVSWIAGRTDVISTSFILLSLISCCYYLIKPSRMMLIASLASFYAALYSKESAIPVPFIILLLAWVQNYLHTEKFLSLKSVQIFTMFAGVECIYFLHRYYALGTFIGGYGSSYHINFCPNIILDHFARYTIRAFLPPLSQENAFLFSHKILALWGSIELICFIGSIAAIIFIVKSGRFHSLVNNKKPELFLLVTLFGCFALSLIPVINMQISLFDTQNERFLYFPSVFVSIGTFYCIAYLFKIVTVYVPVFCFIILFSGFQLYIVNLNWAEAGKISKNIVMSLAENVTSNYILIINAPDNIKGAYISRNCFSHNLLIKFMNRDITLAFNVMSLHSIDSPDNEFKIVIKEKDLKPHFFFSLNGKEMFHQIANDNKYAIVKRAASGDSFECYFKDHSKQFDIFTYCSGTMKKVLLPNNLKSGTEEIDKKVN